MTFTRDQYKSGQHALTGAQVNKLLLSFSDISEKSLIALAIATGLRRDDVINLKRNDFDPEMGTLTYYEKKKKRTRTIFIPSQETIQLLQMHLKTSRKSEWLFPSPKGGKFEAEDRHISSRHIYDILQFHLDSIKVKRRPFHSLRATCYKLCQARGWTPRKAAELLGDTMRVAEEHYDAPSVEEMAAEAQDKPLF